MQMISRQTATPGSINDGCDTLSIESRKSLLMKCVIPSQSKKNLEGIW